jgi:hypothetical protein
MADQTIKVKIHGFTYLQDNRNYVLLNIQRVSVSGIFMWDALNDFFNNEKNPHIIEQAALEEIPPMKEFNAEFEVELVEDLTVQGSLRYAIVQPIDFTITGDYKFTDEENNYNEESI